MTKHSPLAAFQNARAYVVAGDERMATRMYIENRLSYKRYLQALTEGRAIRLTELDETSS